MLPHDNNKLLCFKFNLADLVSIMLISHFFYFQKVQQLFISQHVVEKKIECCLSKTLRQYYAACLILDNHNCQYYVKTAKIAKAILVQIEC